jgi:amidase
VRDSATLLDLTHGPDALTPYMARPPKGSFAEAAQREPGRRTLAVYRNSPLGLEISSETLAALDRAVLLAREGGHSVEEIDLPMVGRDFITDFARVVACAVGGAMRLEAERVGGPVMGAVERGTRVLARYGELMPAADFAATLERLHARSRELLVATARFDAVLMPIIAHPPVAVGGMSAKGADEAVEKLLDNLRLTRLLKNPRVLAQLIDKSLWFTHWPALQNVTGQPSIALPVHMTATGLPLGVQAAGRLGDEETLLSLAGQMERLSGWVQRRAPLRVP